MKTLLISLACLIVSFRASCQDQYFTVQDNTGNVGNTNFLTLGAGQTVAIVNFVQSGVQNYSPTLVVTTSSNNICSYTWNVVSPSYPTAANPFIVAGPATLRVLNGGATLVTYKYLPNTFDPNKTLILPPGTNLVNVTMQSSTNLVNWVTATNGVYGSTNSAMFFRVNIQSP